MNSKDMTIAVLSTTSVVLLVGLLVVNVLPTPAFGSGMTATAGKYVVTVGVGSANNEEYVYIADTSSDRIGVYRFIGGRIELSAGIDLAEFTTNKNNASSQTRPTSRSSRGRRP